jgi:hypothetical protein
VSRTIVVSDLHGSNSLLELALEHAGFGAGDTLVVAGDLIDVGPDDTVALAESLGATILAGNHEVAAAMGLRISPQHPESLMRGPEFVGRFAAGEWPLAAAVDGWLITHAGVSTALSELITEAEDDVDAIARELNRRFRDDIARAVRSMPLTASDLDRFALIGSEMGPLWFRPTDLARIPGGLRQIAGHTPPELLAAADLAALESRGWRLVEPGGHYGEVKARYAVIEDGNARVEKV